MSQSSHTRRYRKSRPRKVVAVGEGWSDGRSTQIAKALTVLGLEQARREAEAARHHVHGDEAVADAHPGAGPGSGRDES